MFEAMFGTLANLVERDRSPDMIDSTIVLEHHCTVGIEGSQEAETPGRPSCYFTSKLHAGRDARGRPLGFILTPWQAHPTLCYPCSG